MNRLGKLCRPGLAAVILALPAAATVAPAAADVGQPAVARPHTGGGARVDVDVTLFGRDAADTVYPVAAGHLMNVGVTVSDRGEASLRDVTVTLDPGDPGDPGHLGRTAVTCTGGVNGSISLEPGQSIACHGQVVATGGSETVPVAVGYRIPGELHPRLRRRPMSYVGLAPALELTTTVDNNDPAAVLLFAKGAPITRNFAVKASGNAQLSDVTIVDPGLMGAPIACRSAPGAPPLPRVRSLTAGMTAHCDGTAPAIVNGPKDCPVATANPTQQVLTAGGFAALPAVTSASHCFLVDPPEAPAAFLPPPPMPHSANSGAPGVSPNTPASAGVPSSASPGAGGSASSGGTGSGASAQKAAREARAGATTEAHGHGLLGRLAHTGAETALMLGAAVFAAGLGVMALIGARRRGARGVED